MNVSAEMYIVVSLMFAVFAAVAAVGTSIVLGVGFERLRAGFEIVKRQSGFFAEAIYKLDERTKEISEQNGKLRESISVMTDKVERVEKTTGFFSDAIQSLEQKILAGTPAQMAQTTAPKTDYAYEVEPILPRDLEWIAATGDDAQEDHTDHFLRTLMVEPGIVQAQPQPQQQVQVPQPVSPSPTRTGGLPDLIMTYFRNEGRGDTKGGIVYH